MLGYLPTLGGWNEWAMWDKRAGELKFIVFTNYSFRNDGQKYCCVWALIFSPSQIQMLHFLWDELEGMRRKGGGCWGSETNWSFMKEIEILREVSTA